MSPPCIHLPRKGVCVGGVIYLFFHHIFAENSIPPPVCRLLHVTLSASQDRIQYTMEDTGRG